jgi:succinate dehydrogenase (ubiquinone) membrane anchor subunit
LPVSLCSDTAYVKGTVNDPTTFPEPHPTHGSYHWAFERFISVALVPLFAVGAVKHGASGVLDASIALTLVVHSHMGFVNCFDDYLHKRKFPIAGPLASWTLKALTLTTLAGLYGEGYSSRLVS